jgi:hypothetical protein
MTNLEIVKALISLKPNAEWTISGDNYENLIWLSNGKPPTLAEIEAEIALLPAKESAVLVTKNAEKAALLERLGISHDEAKLLFS